jgi:anti-anti-sigma regulatory factor
LTVCGSFRLQTARVVGGHELTAQQHCDLRLVCNSPTANLTFATTGLREHFTFADTVPDALSSSL